MNFQTMNKQRKLVLITAAVGVISIFLPWFSAGAFGFSIHINGFHGWGILVFLAFVAAVPVSLMGAQAEPLDKSMWFGVMICGGVALLCVVIAMLSSGGGFSLISAGFGFGIWISLIAAAGIILFAWMFRNPAYDLKSGFDSIKKNIPSTVNKNSTTDKIGELERLSRLKENGTITEEEFQQLKSKHI